MAAVSMVFPLPIVVVAPPRAPPGVGLEAVSVSAEPRIERP